MPLTLVLGPANSAKAGEVLGAYTAAARRGGLLVVPTALDAEHYARELAGDAALVGSVLTFTGLAHEIARRTGLGAPRLTELQRERLLRRAIAAVGLERLAEAAGSPGFAQAAGALIAELQRSLIAPPRFAQALRTWAADDHDRAAYAREVAALYFAYRRELERVGRLDTELLAWRALDALRAAPDAWGSTPVFFYGFDDLHPLQRDAVETLAGAVGAEVTVSLTYEVGRVALAARAETVEELRPFARRVIEMPAVEHYYDPAAREVLHHLERSLFEPGAGRVPAEGVVTLLESGGERAEAELVAGEVLALRQAGVPGDDIAVVLRSPERSAAVFARVFTLYGIPFALERSRPFVHTALGRGLFALARCAFEDERAVRAQVLLDYLRTPGVVEDIAAVDRLEAVVRRLGLTTVAQALAADAPGQLGGATGPLARAVAPLGDALAPLEALRAAPEPADELAAQARRLLAALGRLRAPTLTAGAEDDARACATVLRALAELTEIEPGLEARTLLELLEDLSVPAGLPVRAGSVLIADPLSIRARRFGAVIVCGLQEGEFPLPGAPEPFLSDEVRRELAAASGLRLRPREDALHRERYLFYACVSRAGGRLVFSYRSSDEEGNLALPSPFLRDVADLLDEEWWERRRRRLLADVVWDSAQAPTEHERRRAVAAAGAAGAPGAPRRQLSEAALAHARHREVVSAGALESFADCPVKWLVERQLEPEALEATPEPLARGSFMHDTLERILRELGEAVTPESLPRALHLLEGALRALPRDVAAGQSPAVREAALRAITADLRRYLEHEARDGCTWRPERLEQRFGFDTAEDEDSLPALELTEGANTVRVRGAIDRIDVEPGTRRTVVRDYKSGSVRQDYTGARWSADRRLQVALYMLAVRELLGLEPVAGLYQPLRGGELRPRGAYLRKAEIASCLYETDGFEPAELDALLDDARSRALALSARLRTGEVEPCPATCSRDGCRYPEICRST